MKTKILPLVLFLTVRAGTASAQGNFVLHSGSTDPLAEGFSLNLSPGGVVGPVTNDFGKNSWLVRSQGAPADYSQSLTPQQQQQIAGSDWSLSVTLRVAQFSGASTVPSPLWTAFYTDSQQFALGFGVNTNGDQFVQMHSSLTPVFILNGGGSAYHTYQLTYQAPSGTAALWVDGIERVSDITGIGGFSGWTVFWGAVQGSGTVQAHWNEVVLQAIPEPSVVRILGLGLAAVVGSQFRRILPGRGRPCF